MRILKVMTVAASLTAALFAAGAAQATEYKVLWSGQSFGNSATGVGFIDIDTSVVPDVGFQGFHALPDSAFQILSVTISGASSGNGTFGASDFSSYYFATPIALNYSKELIGQDVGGGCTYGTSTGPCGNGSSGDFNLFGAVAGAPLGVWYFDLQTAGGDQMLVTSISPAPEPVTLALFGAGLAGYAATRRRKKSA